jgi:hypothetical protein
MKKFVPLCSRFGSGALLALAFALFAGCGGDDGGVVDADVIVQVKDGWNRYAAGDFDGARQKFEAAISSDRNVGGGYNGMGWVILATWTRETETEPVSFENEPVLAEALGYFDRAIAEGYLDADPHAGRCFNLNAASEYRQSVNAGLEAVAVDPNFHLPGDEGLDIRDVRLSVAYSYLMLGEYENSLEQAVLINPNLDPISANSETFLIQLRSRLERLYDDLN